MLKFNQYPPLDPSDVQLTDGAEATIKRKIDLTHHELDDVREKAHRTLHAFGQAIGHTLLGASVGNRFPEFSEPFADQHFEIRAGLLTALTDVKQLEEDGAAHV